MRQTNKEANEVLNEIISLDDQIDSAKRGVKALAKEAETLGTESPFTPVLVAGIDGMIRKRDRLAYKYYRLVNASSV